MRSMPADVHQFSIITELLGTPPEDVIQTIASENVSVRMPSRVSSIVLISASLDAPLRSELAEA